MAEPFNDTDVVRKTYFINASERAGDPADDEGKVAQLEEDGKLSPIFTRNGGIFLAGETISGGTTPVPVYQDQSDNELYACDANVNTKYRFIGFVTSDGTDGTPVVFQGGGIVRGFSGLAEGERYYVQDVAGTIGLTPGTQLIQVGVAISPTELLIEKAPLGVAGNFAALISASGSQVVTCGFRPRKVRVSALSGDNSSIAIMEMVWVNGVVSAAAGKMRDAGPEISSALARLYSAANVSTFLEFSITSVTNAGFSVTYSENGSFNEEVAFMWEAEG